MESTHTYIHKGGFRLILRKFLYPLKNMPKHYIVHTLSTMELKGRMKILRIMIWYKFWRIEAKLRNGLRLSLT